jgi:hypothetical protein
MQPDLPASLPRRVTDPAATVISRPAAGGWPLPDPGQSPVTPASPVQPVTPATSGRRQRRHARGPVHRPLRLARIHPSAGMRRLRAMAHLVPLLRRRPGRWRLRDAGMATAEYAIATLAACGFAGLLLVILRSGEMRGLLLGIIRRALAVH